MARTCKECTYYLNGKCFIGTNVLPNRPRYSGYPVTEESSCNMFISANYNYKPCKKVELFRTNKEEPVMEEHKYRIYVDGVTVGEVYEEYIGIVVKALVNEYYTQPGLKVKIERISTEEDYE